MLKKWIVLVFAVAFMLSACNSPVYNQTENNVADAKLKAAAERKRQDDNAKVAPSLVMKKGLYVDKTPISLAKNPSWTKNHIVIKGDQLPFSYYSRSVASGAGSNVLTKYQSGLDQSTRISLNYSGTIRGALDLIASKTGFVYSFQGNTIYWQAFITKTFDVAFMPGGTDYLMGKKSGGATVDSGGGATTNFTNSDMSIDQYSNIGGKLSVWSDLSNTIQSLLSADGKVMVSQATTTVTVRDRPTNVQLVSQYISNLNSKLSKQVLVKIQILEVTLTNDFNMGINWSIIARAFNKSPFVLNGNYGTPVSITNLVSQTNYPSPLTTTQTNPPIMPVMGTVANYAEENAIPSYTILVNALNQQGKTSIVSEPRVVCLNNQVSVIKITEQEGYVASVQNTTLGSTSGSAATSTVTSQISPGNIITGITLYILPKIMDGKIYMQVNADLSVNKGITNFTSGSSTVQLPTITSKSFNQRSVIKSGETLILSGMRQLSNTANATQLFKSQALGGKGSTQESAETVVLITPIILPSGTA